jgi:hypothetical protein
LRLPIVAIAGRYVGVRSFLPGSREEDANEDVKLVMNRVSLKAQSEIVRKLEAIPAIHQVRVVPATS